MNRAWTWRNIETLPFGILHLSLDGVKDIPLRSSAHQGGMIMFRNTLFLTVICFFAGFNACASMALTGDVERDFIGASVMIVNNPSDGTLPGHRLIDVRFVYDPVDDQLHVGMNFAVADDAVAEAFRDGNPIYIRFDFERDGIFDVIAGVGTPLATNGFVLAKSLNRDDQNLPEDFGEILADHPVHQPIGLPTFEQPDVEFSIGHFSQIAGCRTENFLIEVSAGSDHFIRGTAFGLGIVPVADAAGTGISFRVWAPFAQEVSVTGLLHHAAIPLLREEGLDTWKIFVVDGQSASGVVYVITGANGEYLEKRDPRSRAVTSSRGKSLVYDPFAYAWDEGDPAIDPWNEWVIYQLHVGSFHGAGTLDDVIAKLDYLKELGINAIAPLPVLEFPGRNSGGYNPCDPFAIAHQYGGPDAFKRLVEACHRRNMAVIVDVIYNHLGPTDIDLWKFDGWYEDRFGGIYFYQDERADTDFGPRPDFGRPEVRSYILDNLQMFLCEYRVDGFRWDSTVNVRRGRKGDIPDGRRVMFEGNCLIRNFNPQAISIAEDLQDWPELTNPEGSYRFDSQWGSGFYHTLYQALVNANDSDRRVTDIARMIGLRDNENAFTRLVYSENHDEVWELNRKRRLPDRIDENDPLSYWARKRSTLGAAIMMTAPGIPMIFMGQEFLSTGTWRDGETMNWTMTEEQEKIHQLYRDLIPLRRNSGGSTGGLAGQQVNVFRVDDEKKVIAYHRYDQGGAGDDVVVVANFSVTPLQGYRIGFPRPGTWHVRFNSDSGIYGDDFTDIGGDHYETEEMPLDHLANSGEIDIGPYSVVILSQDSAE